MKRILKNFGVVLVTLSMLVMANSAFAGVSTTYWKKTGTELRAVQSTITDMCNSDGSNCVPFTGGGAGGVTSIFTRTGAVVAQLGDYLASLITNTPAGDIAATNVQDAINELDTEKLSVVTSSVSMTGDGTVASPLDVSDDIKGLQAFFNGATLDDVDGTITSDGVTITASLEKDGGGDIRYKTSTGIKIIDTTPAATVTLTAGSDTNPTTNYMYIDVVTGLFTANTTGFPTTEYVPLAISYIGSAAFTQTDGTYKTHQWNDHVQTVGDNGHLTHVNKWIRNQHSSWTSGSALSETGSGTATVNISIASGVMFQLHEHDVPAITSPAKFYIINDETTPFLGATNLASITTDSTGSSINNAYAPFVVWYAYSQITGDSKLFINKPSGSYNSESAARADVDKYANFSIPNEFKGTAILVKRLITRLSGGNVTIYPGAGDDLRGTLPNTAAGSSTSVSSEFLDSVFRIDNITDSTKQIAFDASAITTGTTRTMTVPNEDGTLLVNNNATAVVFDDNLTVGGDLTVNGTTTTLNTTTLDVEAKVITNANVTTPTDTTANAAGWTIKGLTDKVIQWLDVDDLFHFNQGIRIDNANGLTFNDGTTQTTAAAGGGLTWGDSISGSGETVSGITLTSVPSTEIGVQVNNGSLTDFNGALIAAGDGWTNNVSGEYASLYSENENNSNATGYNSGIFVYNKSTTLKNQQSGSVATDGAGAGIAVATNGAGTTNFYSQSAYNNTKHFMGRAWNGLGTTQTMFTADLGTTATGHVGLDVLAKGASTAQRAIKTDMGTTGTGKHMENIYNSNSVFEINPKGGMLKATADICANLDEGALFYNDTSDYFCFCNGTGDDVQMHAPTTACF